MKKSVLLISSIILLTSCVTQKKYDALSQENQRNSKKLSDCMKENAANTEKLEQLLQENSSLKHESKQDDKTNKAKIETLEKENTDLKTQLNEANKKVSEIYNDKSEHLTELSDALYKRELELNAKEHTLDSLQNEFEENQRQMKEMKAQLASKDAQLKKIQNTLKDALLGFTDKGLTIETKNGKVYVLMEEKLLFESGKWDVSSEGKKALKEIASVLEKNTDIDVMVEGHTDNVPLVGKNQIKDNWDLSVMRATSITKILLENKKVNPSRVIPCGRGEYAPQTNNKTAENRAKNRRSEIILSPKVNELLEIIK